MSDFSIVGPDIKITSGAVIALAMTLNKLCTNTTEFGALSVPTGSIDIAWKIDEGMERLQLTWSKKGGPLSPCTVPTELWNALDRVSWPTIERPSQIGVRPERLCVYAGRSNVVARRPEESKKAQ